MCSFGFELLALNSGELRLGWWWFVLMLLFLRVVWFLNCCWLPPRLDVNISSPRHHGRGEVTLKLKLVVIVSTVLSIPFVRVGWFWIAAGYLPGSDWFPTFLGRTDVMGAQTRRPFLLAVGQQKNKIQRHVMCRENIFCFASAKCLWWVPPPPTLKWLIPSVHMLGYFTHKILRTMA